MNHPFGPNGPYFRRPCQRDRFPSLVDEVGVRGDSLVSGLGSLPDMGARLKRGRVNSRTAEKRAAQAAKDANVPPARLFLRSTSRGLRRAIDIYMPRFESDEVETLSEGETESVDSMEPAPPSPSAVRMPGGQPNQPSPAAPRQAEEPMYTGFCRHCRRLGSDDRESDRRAHLMARRIFQNIDLL